MKKLGPLEIPENENRFLPRSWIVGALVVIAVGIGCLWKFDVLWRP